MNQFALPLITVSVTVLVAKCVTAYNDGGSPVRNQARDIFDNDWLTENGSVQDVTDSTVGAFPHLFQAELLYTGLIRSNGGTQYQLHVLF